MPRNRQNRRIDAPIERIQEQRVGPNYHVGRRQEKVLDCNCFKITLYTMLAIIAVGIAVYGIGFVYVNRILEGAGRSTGIFADRKPTKEMPTSSLDSLNDEEIDWRNPAPLPSNLYDGAFEHKSRNIPPDIKIPSSYDFAFEKQIERGEQLLKKGSLTDGRNPGVAVLERLLTFIPNSFRINYALARYHEQKAYYTSWQNVKQSLIKAGHHYKIAFSTNDVQLPSAAKEMIGQKLIEILTDYGNFEEVVPVRRELTELFPDNLSHHVHLGIELVLVQKYEEAIWKFHQILKKWPLSGVSMVYYGWLKNYFGEWDEATKYLSLGINTGEEGTQQGVFYNMLGELLTKQQNRDKAIEYYKKAVTQEIFPSIHQRSLHNVQGLETKPWWSIDDFDDNTKLFFKTLTKHWKRIKQEVIKEIATEGIFVSAAHPQDDNDEYSKWREAILYHQGYKTYKCHLFPFTTTLFDPFPPASQCQRCNIKFMQLKNTRTTPECHPTNTVLQVHLALNTPNHASITVHNETRKWINGELLVFDGSFEHELWHEGDEESALLLIFEMWHPGLDENLRRSLPSL